MVRRSLFVAGMVLALGSIAVTASAQPGGGGGMGGMLGGLFGGGAGATVSNLMLLRMPEVQTELSLTADQQTQLNSLIRESTQKLRDSFSDINFQDLANATQEERQKMMTDIRKKVEDGSKGLDDKVGTILNATQSKRLHELMLQRLGAAALVLPDTVKATWSEHRTGDEDQRHHLGGHQCASHGPRSTRTSPKRIVRRRCRTCGRRSRIRLPRRKRTASPC